MRLRGPEVNAALRRQVRHQHLAPVFQGARANVGPRCWMVSSSGVRPLRTHHDATAVPPKRSQREEQLRWCQRSRARSQIALGVGWGAAGVRVGAELLSRRRVRFTVGASDAPITARARARQQASANSPTPDWARREPAAAVGCGLSVTRYSCISWLYHAHVVR